MKAVKGSSIKIESVVYLHDQVIANISGADITVMVKKNVNDPDSAALITKTVGSGVTIVDGGNGRFDTVITAAETNTLSVSKVHIEALVNLTTGEYIRSGIENIELEPNLIKVLN